MRLEYQILMAAALDLAWGDPRWLPHPVRGIGRLAMRLEALSRRWLGDTRAGGAFAAIAAYLVAGCGAWAAIQVAAAIDPLAGDVASIATIYTTIAARDLADHSMAVFRSLASGDLADARRQVGRMVGRDTDTLDEAGVVRAAVESLAESTVDGVTGPLFYAALAGPAGAMVYRAINTLDSMFGHQDERYCRFGWAAARIDDLANYLPARCTAPLLCIAAFLLRLNAAASLRVLLRDGRKHASPNAGLAEAAMAGALGVELGGLRHYGGRPFQEPAIGEPLVPLCPGHIRSATAVMLATAGLFLPLCLALRVALQHLWQAGRMAG